MRASDSDRDRVLTLLREAYAQGRITMDELSERVTRTLSAQTHEELQAVVADLAPAPLPAPPASPPPAPYPYRGHRGYGRYPVRYRGWRGGLIVPLVLIGSFWWVPWLFGSHFFFFPFVFFGAFFLFGFWRRALRS